jgi:phage tail-like protein
MKLNEIKTLLPEVFQRSLCTGNPLLSLLKVMEMLHAPSEAVLSGLDAIFDPRRTREDFVPYLARWVNLERVLFEPVSLRTTRPKARQTTSLDLGRMRELIVHAATLSKWRGTARGLLLFLQIATGIEGYRIEEQTIGEDGRVRPFHLRIVAPGSAALYRPTVERIIEQEKPAYVTYMLEFEP